MSVLALFLGASIAAFLVGCALKGIRYARMPVHVRWELYPVAHEKGRASYGGSYFEELDWWTKPRHRDHLADLKVIAGEVLTMHQVRERNPGLWMPSLLFHYGMYLLFGLGALLLLQAGATAVGAGVPAFARGGTLLSLWGAAGLGLGTLGAAGLLVRRVSDPQLRNASTPADLVHLVWLLLVFAASWGSWILVDRQFTTAASFLAGLARGQALASPSAWFTAQLVLLGGFLAYLPSSHMTHFFAKYFTWHSVRWDDRPAIEDGARMAKVAGYLGRPVSWSAEHIGADGKRTWADVATAAPGRKEHP
jgi:nitrate reductase gamma subunit